MSEYSHIFTLFISWEILNKSGRLSFKFIPVKREKPRTICSVSNSYLWLLSWWLQRPKLRWLASPVDGSTLATNRSSAAPRMLDPRCAASVAKTLTARQRLAWFALTTTAIGKMEILTHRTFSIVYDFDQALCARTSKYPNNWQYQ